MKKSLQIIKSFEICFICKLLFVQRLIFFNVMIESGHFSKVFGLFLNLCKVREIGVRFHNFYGYRNSIQFLVPIFLNNLSPITK